VATVGELSAPYTNFMLGPLPATAADVCGTCLTFTQGYGTCYRCGHQARFTDAVVPISYSVHFGQLHTALQQYKRAVHAAARPLELQLAAVLWRFLAGHERCLAGAAGVDRFELVATVPSSDPRRDETHPLRRIVGEIVEPTRGRYRRLLMRSGTPVPERTVDPGKYGSTEDLNGENVLLIDDTWTTGANVQSAAAALKTAGANRVGVVVIGRHIHEDYQDNAERLKALSRRFDWDTCALHVDHR
jgi:predicted amidophosphoribosyltransferase